MKRRDFLRLSGLFPVSLALEKNWPRLIQEEVQKDEATIFASDSFLPYDASAFEAAERIVFLNSHQAVVNVIPRSGLSLDLRLVLSAADIFISRMKTLSFQGVKDSLDILIENYFWGPELSYRLEYRESSAKTGWRATPWRRVKTPLSYLQKGNVKIIFYSDDHTFDDADMGQRVVEDKTLRNLRLNGDYINLFLKELMTQPDFIPDENSEWSKMMSGFCLASALRQIMLFEKPDLIFILGDTTGIGAGYKWKGLGLKDPVYGLNQADLDEYSRLFWLRMRKMLSAITPTIPVYLVLGNHDGESFYDVAREAARFYRQKYWRQPGAESGSSIFQNYFSLRWGERWPETSDLQIIVLDNESYNPPWMPLIPEQWTLGETQKQWFKNELSREASWKFVCFHHVLGGWPRGTNEAVTDYCYGRGPLFTLEDYQGLCARPESVEQVTLTRWMLESGVKALFYGHDHVFHLKMIKDNQNRQMLGICVGSTKHVGELLWYKGELWNRFYGPYGAYWTEIKLGDPRKANFWGPSGYTRLIIDKNEARLEYVRAAYNHPYTNIPPEIKNGQVLISRIL